MLLRSVMFAIAALAIIGVASWGVLTAGGDPDTPSAAGQFDDPARPNDGSANPSKSVKDRADETPDWTYTSDSKQKKKETKHKK